MTMEFINRKCEIEYGYLTTGMSLSGQLSQIHRHHARYSFFHHRDSIDHISGSHRALVVRDNHKLAVFAEVADDGIELVNVGIIERSIHLIENTERGRLQ